VVDRGLGQHGVVLQLRLAERRGVAGDEDQLGLARAESYGERRLARIFTILYVHRDAFSGLTLQGGLVTQNDLARLHHQGEARVEGVSGLGLLLGGHLD
jgi:hypothetical protein